MCFNNDNPWESYYEFVKELTAGDPQLRHRFYSYHDRTEKLRSFKDRISSLAVARGSQDSILFAALNSCNIQNNDTIVKPEVGEEQWNGLRKLLENEPIKQLRIAILHHPIFAAPGGDFPDERPLFDQAEAVHRLSNLNFQLLIHGHSHFSAVYEHRVTILNEPSCHSASKLTVIACPTCGAEPSSSTPIRQYMIISIGQYDRATNSRSLRVRTRIYNQSTKTWSEGGAPFDSKIFIEVSKP